MDSTNRADYKMKTHEFFWFFIFSKIIIFEHQINLLGPVWVRIIVTIFKVFDKRVFMSVFQKELAIYYLSDFLEYEIFCHLFAQI